MPLTYSTSLIDLVEAMRRRPVGTPIFARAIVAWQSLSARDDGSR